MQFLQQNILYDNVCGCALSTIWCLNLCGKQICACGCAYIYIHTFLCVEESGNCLMYNIK